MPHFDISVCRWHDWQPVDKADGPSVTSASGETLGRTTIDEPSVVSVGMPEVEVTDCMAHFSSKGNEKTREAVIAWYLEDVVLPGHAPMAAVTGVTSDEPDVADYLTQRWNLTPKKGKK